MFCLFVKLSRKHKKTKQTKKTEHLKTCEWHIRSCIGLIYLKLQLEALEKFSTSTVNNLMTIPRLFQFGKESFSTDSYDEQLAIAMVSVSEWNDQEPKHLTEEKEKDNMWNTNNNNNRNDTSNNNNSRSRPRKNIQNSKFVGAKLNESQQFAIAKSIVYPVSLIQGPPGTGKTVTAAKIVEYLCDNTRRRQDRGLIVIVVNTHLGCDNVLKKLLDCNALLQNEIARMSNPQSIEKGVC